MVALFWALLDRANFYRQIVRISLIFVIADFVVFFLTETIIAAMAQSMFHPAVSIFGIIWMALTAFSIWYFGGATADIVVLAGMVDEPTEKDGWLARTAKEACGPARAILRAVKFFFLLEGLIVCYFLVVPVWHVWPAHFAIMVLLMVFIICGNLLGRKWPLATFRSFSGWVMAMLVAGIFLAAGYNYFTGESLTSDKVRDSIKAEVKKAKVSAADLFKKKDGGEEKANSNSGEKTLQPRPKKLAQSTPAPAVKAKVRTQPKEPYEITVALQQDWSRPIYLPAESRFTFFGPKAEFRREADGFLGDTYSRYPDDPRFQSGLRFRGPEGQRLTIKVVPG